MMLGTNSDIPVSIMGLVSTYLASFFLFCKLPFKWYLAMDCLGCCCVGTFLQMAVELICFALAINVPIDHCKWV